MAKLIILSGIPFSERDKYAKSLEKEYTVLSKDEIRKFLYGNYCIITNKMEVETNEAFEFRLKKAYLLNLNIVYNGTNCREAFIDKIIAECPIEYDIEVRFFDYPLWKAVIKNFLNHYRTDLFIPFHVLKSLKVGYDSINKSKYRHYCQRLAITQQKW